VSGLTWLLVAKRELRGYLRSPFGYVIIAAMLLIDGLLFYGFALSSGPRLSAEVLRDFFFYSSGTTAVAAVLLSMRLFAEERQTGTLVLLSTSPLREAEVVIGKFVGAFTFIALMTALTAYMPLLIFVNGKVSMGHIFVGYLGLLLLGAATLSVGLFASALAPTQVLAAIVGAAILGALYLLWLVARVTDPPISSFLAAAALHNEQFRPFMTGIVDAGNVTYYVGVTLTFLLAATKTLEARRWR
jgi:ABC-2 type transport system permease protein